MRYVTHDHIWLEDDPATGRLNVGITEQGNDEMNGIIFVGVEGNSLVVESSKTALEIKPPVTGTMVDDHAEIPVDWDEKRVFAHYEPGSWEWNLGDKISK